MNGVKIIGTGSALPSRRIKNETIAEAAGTTDEFIKERTGIESRFYCGEDESQLSLAVKAAVTALEHSGIDPKEIGICIAATMTPEYATPSTACMIQKELGLRENIPSFDINAACSGFPYALETARCFMYANDVEYAIVTASERFSDMMDITDYGTVILFGDGAAAVVIQRTNEVYHASLHSRGDDVIRAEGPGSRPSIIKMNGREVFRFATAVIEESVKQITAEAEMSISDVDHFVFHQANARIIDHVSKRMKLDPNKVHKNISGIGNTSAASIPLVLDELVENDRLKDGDTVLMVAFGGGLTWASILMKW